MMRWACVILIFAIGCGEPKTAGVEHAAQVPLTAIRPHVDALATSDDVSHIAPSLNALEDLSQFETVPVVSDWEPPFAVEAAQLARLRTLDPSRYELFAERYAQHRRSLTEAQTRALASRLAWHRYAVVRNYVMGRIIHPAIRQRTGRDQNTHASIQTVIGAGRAASIQVEHVVDDRLIMLDGLILHPSSGPEPEAALVVLPPNIMQYEDLLKRRAAVGSDEPWLFTMAEAFTNLDLVLYNGRGVGLSIGEEFTTDDMVQDCVAVVREMQRRYRRVGVLGLSLGGNVATLALAQVNPQVELFLNVHSASSLTAVAAHDYDRGIWYGGIKSVFTFLGLSDLDAIAVLRAGPVARYTMVVTASHDDVIVSRAQIASKAREIAREDMFEVTAGEAHGDVAGVMRHPQVVQAIHHLSRPSHHEDKQ